LNSRERMDIAMGKGTPDRVPLMCQLSTGHLALQTDFSLVEIWHDTEAYAQALMEMHRRYGFDGVLVNLPGRDPGWRAQIERIEEREGETVIHWRGGLFTVAPHDDLPHVFTADGERRIPTLDEIDPDRLLYMEPHDISGVDFPFTWGFAGDPAPVDRPGEFFPPWQLDAIRRVRELSGGELSVHGEIFSPFTQLMEMLDHAQALMALVMDPAKVHAILKRFTEGAIALGRLQASEGVDAILISSAFTGAGMISRSHYEEFELPTLRRVIEGIRELNHDLPVYVHTCGAIGDRLDLMEQTGLDGIDTLDPPPLGTVELDRALEILGKRVFIKGNLDPVNTLLEGTPADVRREALERLSVAKPGGAYILSTACSVAPHTPPENLLTLREVIEAEGWY
jgi:uroporphyrinogen-III decarboxylase